MTAWTQIEVMRVFSPGQLQHFVKYYLNPNMAEGDEALTQILAYKHALRP